MNINQRVDFEIPTGLPVDELVEWIANETGCPIFAAADIAKTVKPNIANARRLGRKVLCMSIMIEPSAVKRTPEQTLELFGCGKEGVLPNDDWHPVLRKEC